MSLENLLDHKCDIYHLTRISGVFGYHGDPDSSAVPCHFSIKDGVAGRPNLARKPGDGYTTHDTRVKLTLPAGVLIHRNDKVVNLFDGSEYTAEIPKDVRGHHTVVYLKKTGLQKALT